MKLLTGLGLLGVLLLLGIALFVGTGEPASPTDLARSDLPAAVKVDLPPVPLPRAEPEVEVESETTTPAPADRGPLADPYADLQKELESEPPASSPPAPVAPAQESDLEHVRVERVIDGDTVVLTDGRKIRLIGMNTPERGKPLYGEAKEALARLVEGAELSIEYGKESTDKYRRTLAYLHKGETFVNGEIVRQGLAYCYTWRPNTRYCEELKKLQQEARASNAGLWALEPPAPSAEGYRASRWAHRFHRPDCAKAKAIRPKDLQSWKGRDEALDEGFNPCETCDS